MRGLSVGVVLLGAALPAAGAAQLPHDIRGLLPYVTPWWVYALGAALAAALIAAAVFFYRRWRRRQLLTPPVPADPWDVLKHRLSALRPATPFAGRAAEEYFFQLSILLRESIELRTRIPATDRTWQELREPLRQKLPLARDEVESLLAFLERADLVKFAGAPTTVDEAAQSSAQVGGWLRRLKPLSIDAAAEADPRRPFLQNPQTEEGRDAAG